LDWFQLGRGFRGRFDWLGETEGLFAIVWFVGVELGQILGSFSRAGEVVVVGAVEVFVVSAKPNKIKR
jgi:hypothetical protein